MANCSKYQYTRSMSKKEVHLHVLVEPEFRQRIRMVLAKEDKTFKQLFHELFEQYLEEKGE